MLAARSKLVKLAQRRLALPAAASVLAAAVIALPAPCAERQRGWTDKAEFSYVVTAGNSETATLGFKNKLSRQWERSSLTFRVAAVRAESTTVRRTAIGPDPGNFVIDEASSTELTAENYSANGRYDWKVTNRFFWYSGAGWERNRFSGIENRTSAVGGVGNIWFDREGLKFSTDYALTYTDQQDVNPAPDADEAFLGARFSWSYQNAFGENTTYVNDLTIDENLDESADYRVDMTNSIAVAINKRLALQLSLQLLYDNEPSLAKVPLLDAPGGTQIGTVFVERDELDTVFTASLVVDFK